MSTDGTLPPGCEHADIERAAGGDDDTATCCQCSEPRSEDSLDGTMCDSCAAEHYRGLYRMMRRVYPLPPLGSAEPTTASPAPAVAAGVTSSGNGAATTL